MVKRLLQPQTCLLLLLILALPLCARLLTCQLIQGHDAYQGFLRQICMEKYFAHGQFVIRWSPDVNWGYGSPVFNFYQPLFYYISLLFYKITDNTILSMNLVCVVFWLLSGAGMYLFAREFWGEMGGVLSAVAYMYFPYHVQEFYVRGAFSELCAFGFFPLLLLAIFKINQRGPAGYCLLGAASACLAILTHVIGVFFLAAAFVYSFFLYMLTREGKTLFIRLSVLLSGFMACAFYWLPGLNETRFLKLQFITSMRYDFHQNFLSLWQIFYVPGFHVTPYVIEYFRDRDHLTFQIGVPWLLLTLLTLSTLLFLIRHKKNTVLPAHAFFFFCMAVTSVFLIIPASTFFWEHVHTLKFFQLPWRFLIIVSFAVSFLAGGAVLLFSRNATVFLGIAVAMIMAWSYPYFTHGTFEAVDQQAVKSHLSDFPMLGEGEQTPKWVQIPPAGIPPQKFEILKGNGRLGTVVSVSPIHYKVKLEASTATAVCFHTFYFPGWRVFVDGKTVPMYFENPYGVILFVVPPGSHELQAAFGLTAVRIMAMLISWVGVVLLLVTIASLKAYATRQH